MSEVEMECQNHANCGDYCETEREREMCLCEDCLDSFDQRKLDQKRLRELAADNKRLEALSVESIMLDIVPGFDGMGEEVYAKSVADVENKLSFMGDRLEALEGRNAQLAADKQRLEGEVARLRETVECARDELGGILGTTGPARDEWIRQLGEKLDAALSTANGEVT